MSAIASRAPTHKTFVVVVERQKQSTTVGPYRQFARADGDARAWDGTDGRSAWVEPVTSPDSYSRRRGDEEQPTQKEE
jgi:hypothetical protein